MAEACALKAHVKNPQGEIVESRLFNDLLHYTSNDRQLTKEYYAVGTDKDFLNMVQDREEFKTDENGEITFASLRTLTKMDIEADKLLKVLNKDIGQGEYDYEEALRRVQNFNTHNPMADRAMAILTPTSGGRYTVSVTMNTSTVTDIDGKESKESNVSDTQKKLHDTVRNKEVEKRIIALLRGHHVSVDFLENKQDGGRYSTENISAAEDGLYALITINGGGNVTDTLAEEAGHFAIGAMGNHPLVQRLEKILSSPEAQKEALGQEEYENTALGKNPAREVAGRLVGKALQRKLGNNSSINVLANRIANIAKRMFAKISGNEVRWAAAKAEQIANRIAYQFIEGNSNFSVQNAIDIEETMMHGTTTMNQRIFRDTVDELGRLCKRLEAISEDNFAGQANMALGLSMLASVDETSGESALQMAGQTADAFAFDGVVQAVVQISNFLGQGMRIDNMLSEIDSRNPSKFYTNMAANGRKLRQVRTFLYSARSIIDNISQSLDYDARVKLNTVGPSAHEVQYQDSNNVWQTLDLINTLEQCSKLVRHYEQKLNIKESAYFAQFCTDVYGHKYISGATGVLWKDIREGQSAGEERKITFEDAISGEGITDIDIFHRFLGSMSNNPDVVGQIADKVMKTANKNADDFTLRDTEDILILDQRARDLGLNMSDLMEKDTEGVPTGNLITPPAQPNDNNPEETAIYNAYMNELNYVPAINHGAWEAARDKAKQEAWEEFKEANPGWESWVGIYRGLKWDEFYRKRYKEWNKNNSILIKVTNPQTGREYSKWIPNGIYTTDAWSELEKKYPKKGNDSILRWVSDYMAVKKRLDDKLPMEATLSYRLPQVRGTLIDTMRNTEMQQSGNFRRFKAFNKGLRRRILDSFVVQADETDFGDMSTMNSSKDELLGTPLNYEQERSMRLTTFGINKLDDMRDLSNDILGSLIAYSSMANSYMCTDAVVDALEVGRSTLYTREFKDDWLDRQLKKTKGGKALYKKMNSYRKPQGITETIYEGSKNRAFNRYIKFLDKQVYGISSSYFSFSLFGKQIVPARIMNNLSSLAGFTYLQGNVLGGMVNTNTGFLNIFKEALSSEFFNTKDWGWAHRWYFKHFFQMWGSDAGKIHKNNKLGLFLEMVNAQGDNKTKFRHWRTNRSRVTNFLNMSGYLPYSSGDHYMQAMSYLSVAHGTNLYDIYGNKVSNLWDAYKTRENKDDLGDFKKGKTIEFEKLNPVAATSITIKDIDSKGVYLKPIKRNDQTFYEWAITQDARFADDAYRRDNQYEYFQLKEKFDNLSEKELMQYVSQRYQLAESILRKVENYKNDTSPLKVVPTFTQEEEDYLRMLGRGDTEYDNILASVKNDIFSLIWNKDEESAYMDKCREINNRLHGIYNQQDKTAAQQNWFFNAVLAMRGWALGNLENMWSNNHYSMALDRYTEGFMNTALKVGIDGFWRRRIDTENRLTIIQALTAITVPWSQRSKNAMNKAGYSITQYNNMKRFAAHMYLMTLLYLAKWATTPPPKEEDEDGNPWIVNMMYYLSMRAYYEQSALAASIDFINSATEMHQLAEIVPVGISATIQLGELLWQLVNTPFHEEDNSDYYYQQDDPNGKYKEGDWKALIKIRGMIPYYKSLWGLQHPDAAADAYSFGRKMK